MILIIDICENKLHYHDFVRPIEDILKSQEIPFITKHYSDIKQSDLDSCHRVIITGTSLKDSGYLKHLSKFDLLINFQKPLLGICAGMQILCSIHGCKIEKGSEIGVEKINFTAKFLGVSGSREVYSLHTNSVKNDDKLHDNFHIYSISRNNMVHAIKHRKYRQYGVLFHPEVRNKDMIVNFLNE